MENWHFNNIEASNPWIYSFLFVWVCFLSALFYSVHHIGLCSVNFVLRYFIIFDTGVNKAAHFILDCLLLVYTNAVTFKNILFYLCLYIWWLVLVSFLAGDAFLINLVLEKTWWTIAQEWRWGKPVVTVLCVAVIDQGRNNPSQILTF